MLCGCAILSGDVILAYETIGIVEHKGCRAAVTDGTPESARAKHWSEGVAGF
jgi:hypothetical protein